MSDVQRLEAELALARLSETLEEARDAMHADSNPETVSAYREASEATHAARRAFREQWRVVPAEGDAAPLVDTVTAGAAVNEAGVA